MKYLKKIYQKRHIKDKSLEMAGGIPLEKHFEHFLSGGAGKI